MPDFVVFVNNDGYRKYTSESAKAFGASVPTFCSGLQKGIFKIHNAWPLNKNHELPGKSIWYNICFDESNIRNNADIYFIFYESFHMSYSKSYIMHLREKYVNSKTLFFFTNPVNEYNLARLSVVRHLYDLIMTFNEKDAKLNGFLYCNYDALLLPDISVGRFSTSDVFFVGADKGRLSLILSAFEKLTEKGVKCDFHIVDVPKDKQLYKEFISYNRRISYDEVLKRVKNTKCVLEILQEGNNYHSIRTIEAIQYQKKLLTTNIEITSQWFYDPEIIQVFSQPSDISTDFIYTSVNDDIYSRIKIGSFDMLAEFIVNNIRRCSVGDD